MKLTSRVIVNIGVYQHIECDIEIDTDQPEKAQELIRFLHYHFFGLLQADRLQESAILKQQPKDGKWMKPNHSSELVQKKRQEFVEDLQGEIDAEVGTS